MRPSCRVHRTIPAVAAAIAVLATAAPAGAQSAEGPDFAAVVAAAIERVVVPGYRALAEAADGERQALAALCEAPGAEPLAAARERFAGLVEVWSAVEPYRFGPAREDYRFERLFFWPDRRGRGLKQVQEILATEDETALGADRLRQKSVAVQGLLALEFVLFGSDAEALASTGGNDFRCRYGAAIAGAIEATASEIVTDWTRSGGFAETMTGWGPDNPVYRTGGEAVQELLRAAAEQLEIAADLKIGAPLGASAKSAKPKIAPFWRSGLVLQAVAGNVAGVRSLHDESGLGAALPEGSKSFADSFDFELAQAERTVAELTDEDRDWSQLVRSEEERSELAYVVNPLKGAVGLLTESYPSAFGLIVGFNTLDGD